jgi:DNA-binding transcriptional MerR regulator
VNDPDPPAAGERDRREYRITELARAAGFKVRTLRYYQERRLLPPPRHEGRIAWYSEAHLARLRLIGQLLERGHTLGGIAELLAAWEEGRDVAELLGFERAMTAPWSEETPVTLALDEVVGLYGDSVDPAALARAVELGYVTLEGDQVLTHSSRRLLDASVTLVKAGIPLEAVLDASEELQRSVDAMAALFVALVRTHIFGRYGDRLPPAEIGRIAEVVDQLRPLARTVVDAELARAMDRRMRAEFGEVLDQLAPAEGQPRAI